MPVAVAFCPCPPLLVPAVAAGSAADLNELRAACDEAVETIIAAHPQRILVVGAGEPAGRWGGESGGSMRPYGVDLRCGGVEDQLPLPLLVGAYLLDRAGWGGDRAYVAVGGSETLQLQPDEAWLVLADGTATRSDTSPGQPDARAIGFDAAVARALAGGDAAALAGLDLDLAGELWCGGAPAWRVVGGSLSGRDAGDARLLAEQAPYGVAYLVATWLPRGDGRSCQA